MAANARPSELGGFWAVLGGLQLRMKYVNFVLAAVSGIGLVAIGALTVLDVVTRKMNATLSWPYEVNLLIFGWSVFLGLAMVQSDRAQIGVDIFGDRIPKSMLRLRAVVMDLLAFAFVAVIAWLGFVDMIRTYQINERTNSLLALPVWVSDLAVVLGMTAFAVTILIHLLLDFSPAWRDVRVERTDIASEIM